MSIELKEIGLIHTPFKNLEGMPIQPSAAKGSEGTVELYDQYQDGLEDLNGFSHIILIYQFHQSKGFNLRVVPYLDSRAHGVFATRAPKRPNPIGLSVVKLKGIDLNVLHIENVDMLDGTPLLDIKPYVPEFDAVEALCCGWLESSLQGQGMSKCVSDDRFK